MGEHDVARYLDERIAAGDFPGAVFVARERGRETAAVARGDAVVAPERIPATLETVFDLASLTKPLATALLACMEAEAGRLSLDDPVAAYLAEFDREDKRRITLRHLLTHASGLPKWVPLYAAAGDPSRAAEAIAALPLAYETGTRVVYSDPNFVALGLALERAAGSRLDALFAERVARPLGLARTGYLPDPGLRPEIAASETGNEYERRMAESLGDAAAGYDGWRTGVLWGEVHDGNAHFLGGVAGHAGLFGPAREVARVAEQFLPGSLLLSREETFAAFRTDFTPGLEEHRSLGWMLASTPGSSAGPALPPDAFGHTGFTGTSVWVDPRAARVFVLLTNRTHPTYNAPPMAEIRRRVHELAIRTWIRP
jgi:CubicO group peptidase (beta-lactamase class C family)